MSKLAFLQNVQVIGQEATSKKSAGGGVRKEWNPASGLAIRLWKDGSVFPSQELVDKFDLEYRPALTEEQLQAIKDEKMEKPFAGNGFDVADSQDFPAFNTGGARLLIAALAEKDAGKVDLFSSVGYNDDGTPKLKVVDQGAVTFGKEFLIPKIEEIYGIVFAKPAIPAVEAKPAVEAETDDEGKVVKSAKPATEAKPEVPAVEGVEYIDLVLVGKDGTEGSDPFEVPENKPIVYIPKIVSRGDKKGESTVARRERPKMYVLYPKQLLDQETEEQPNGQPEVEAPQVAP